MQIVPQQEPPKQTHENAVKELNQAADGGAEETGRDAEKFIVRKAGGLR